MSNNFIRRLKKSPNPLLARKDVGIEVGKPLHKVAADPGYAYGTPSHRDPEGVKQLTTIWNNHISSPSNQSPRDFRRLNSASVVAKCVSPKD